MSFERWKNAGLEFTITDNDTGVTTVHNENNVKQERATVKEWGRTVVRLRENGSFADLITAEIAVSDLTVKQIASACNTSSASINKWKAGIVYPAAHYLYRLAKCLHSKEDVLNMYLLYTLKIDSERA